MDLAHLLHVHALIHQNEALLVWEDKNGYLFWIKGWMVDRETVEQIANSMTYYQEDGISYEVDEIPDG